MAATTFEVPVSIDDDRLRGQTTLLINEKAQIVASFTAALDHWIAERRLELRYAD